MWCQECKKVVGTVIKPDGKPDLLELSGGWVATLKCGHVQLVPRSQG